MKSLYHAYEAYEHRIIRGEMDTYFRKEGNQPTWLVLLFVRVGDLLSSASLKLKRIQADGKPMSWSQMTGSKS